VQAVPINTQVVSLNPAHGDVCLIFNHITFPSSILIFTNYIAFLPWSDSLHNNLIRACTLVHVCRKIKDTNKTFYLECVCENSL
jgi:hypothetical protein